MENRVERGTETMAQEFVGFSYWYDPRLERDLSHYHSSVDDLLNSRNENSLQAAASLCETSRAILYRLPRINEEQARHVVAEFQRAVAAIRAIQFAKQEEQEQAKEFAAHIERRIINLIGNAAMETSAK